MLTFDQLSIITNYGTSIAQCLPIRDGAHCFEAKENVNDEAVADDAHEHQATPEGAHEQTGIRRITAA